MIKIRDYTGGIAFAIRFNCDYPFEIIVGSKRLTIGRRL